MSRCLTNLDFSLGLLFSAVPSVSCEMRDLAEFLSKKQYDICAKTLHERIIHCIGDAV